MNELIAAAAASDRGGHYPAGYESRRSSAPLPGVMLVVDGIQRIYDGGWDPTCL
jgi:hypothetical protein